MNIWAIADLHLSNGNPDKHMKVFGEQWENYMNDMKTNCNKLVSSEDLLLIPGDISWSMNLDLFKEDMKWIEGLPGQKVMIKGNHDYWWSSVKKVRALLPPSIAIIQNDSYNYESCSIAGSRMWDSELIGYDRPNIVTEEKIKADQVIFNRELQRLESSLQSMDPNKSIKIAMLHFPPVNFNMDDSPVTKLLEKYNIDICIFGHLHGLNNDVSFGVKNGIRYELVASDFISFSPKLIV